MPLVASGGSYAIAIIGAFTDIVFISIGALCPYLNYKLQQRIPSNQDLKGMFESYNLFPLLNNCAT